MNFNHHGSRQRSLFIGKSWFITSLMYMGILYIVAQVHIWFMSLDFSGESAVSMNMATTRVKTSKSQKPVMPIKEISVIGERNSGTRWIASHLTECFNHSLNVRDKLVRHKHWFQHDVPTGRPRVGTAVVAVFRHPLFWVEAMRRVPHHSPLHYKLNWEDFVKTPWTMPRLPLEVQLLHGQPRNITAADIHCQEYFNYDQINSCQLKPYNESYFADMSGHEPQYELRNDGSGRPYGSIIDLRSDKIKNHLSVAEWIWVQDFFQVRYEELLQNGTGHLIQHVEKITGVTAKCNPSPPQIRKKRKLSSAFVSWMAKHVDWETEELIGYKPYGLLH